MKKIVFYTNQFFGQIGGEDQAGVPPSFREGPVGPANLLAETLKGEITATVICGDNYYAENIEKVREVIFGELEKLRPDMLIAGPAFNAGRFGVACGDICSAVSERLGIPTVTGMYPENPGVDMYRSNTVIVETGHSAAQMKKAALAMTAVANKLLRGEALLLPEEEGYIPRGIRVNIFKDDTGAVRAVDMLLSKLAGKPYKSEVPLPDYKAITPAPGVADIRSAKVALLTTGGIVPFGNPDRLPAATSKFFKAYRIKELDALESGKFIAVHAGYDPVYANDNPNLVAPLDLLKRFEKSGAIGELYEDMIVTTGNSTSVADATRMGADIAVKLAESGVQAAILTST